MDKTYNHKNYEEKIYDLWVKKKAFKPKGGKPYTILMPPPNANASLHAGHAMYTVDDILIRWKRMQGYAALWIPGLDHAGFETQFVYEKHLAKKGKSRMDFNRQTLYQDISKFVSENSGLIFKQFKRLGFSADWERCVFTLDKNVLDQVFETFQKMEKEGFVYRDSYIVNYCVRDGTSLAELEVKHLERKDPLYFIKYPIVGSDQFVTVATVRPETMFGDTALAVHPKDKRYVNLVGKKVKLPLTKREIPIIADENVDKEFGTGALKITPAHDPNDFEIGKKHNLKVIQVINRSGKMVLPSDIEDNEKILSLNGQKATSAREIIVKLLKENIEKVDANYTHSVVTCYKCGKDLEPLPITNWYLRVKDLKKPVVKAVKKGTVSFFPKKYKRHMLAWLEIMHDWPISRQIVWGIQIPAWYSVDENPETFVAFINKGKIEYGKIRDLINKFSLREIKKGIQTVNAPSDAKYVISKNSPGERYIQETDTFDTWFSSSQWPLVSLKKDEFKTRFPTDTLGTLSDILKFWVSRMIMFSLYTKKEIPFKDVYLWSMVADVKGVKMSKSKGNVINPLDLIEKYGADALRMSLMYGTPAGSKVILADEKVKGMRNFANKLWNISRFIKMNWNDKYIQNKKDSELTVKTANLIKEITNYLDSYQLDKASSKLYEFVWHYLADKYIEENKERIQSKDPSAILNLRNSYVVCLKLLHPFMPFITEAIWQENEFLQDSPLLMVSKWPKV